MNEMTITNAQYSSYQGENITVMANIDGIIMSVPLDPRNRHYAEILRQVEEGTLVIQPADEPEGQTE
jgi:hypothetical protein